MSLLSLALACALWGLLLRPRLSFPRSESDYYMPDAVLGHRHRPYARREFAWPEHPKKWIVMQTNNLGLRRDQDVQPQKPAGTKRVLVVGDSNLDGVVHNSESFASHLESLLNSRPGGTSRFEILNAATGHYGPDNYLAALEAYDHLGFDAVIAGFYTGNDFLDAVRNIEDRLPRPLERPRDYMTRLRRANKIHSGSIAQRLNQDYYFSTFPEMREAVLSRVGEIFLQMSRRAQEKNVLLFVILIPTKQDVEPEHLGPDWTRAVCELQLAEAALQITPQMRIELGQRLRQAGVSCLDPANLMKMSLSEAFWRQDYHLSITGHRLLADHFFSEFGAAIQTREEIAMGQSVPDRE